MVFKHECMSGSCTCVWRCNDLLYFVAVFQYEQNLKMYLLVLLPFWMVTIVWRGGSE